MNKLKKKQGFSKVGVTVAAIVIGILGLLGWKAYDMATNKPTVNNVTKESIVDITPDALTDLKDIATIQAAAVVDKPGVTVIHIELEQGDSGPLVYKAQLSDGTVTVYNARTGGFIKSIASAKTSTESLPTGVAGGIGFAKAVEIARAEQPGSKVYKIELELEGGVVVYSVRFTDKARVDVKADDGTIVRTKAARISDPATTETNDNSGPGSTNSNSGSGSSDDNSGSGNSGSGNDDSLSSSDDDDSDDSDEDDGTDDSGNSGSGKNR